MCIKKKLLAVAVALCVAVPSSFAAWDYFPVIEQGSAEAKLSYDGGLGLQVRYGLIEKLELFAAQGNDVDDDGYAIGARYQIIPDMLSAYADLGIPRGNGVWGLTPGIQISTNFTETISLGVGLGLPLHLNQPEWGDSTTDNPRERGFGLDLAAGLELDIAFNDNVTFWVGADFLYDNLTSAGYDDNNKRPDFKVTSDVLSPALGFIFTKDNLAVGTSLGFKWDVPNDKDEDSIGLIGGVDFTVKF